MLLDEITLDDIDLGSVTRSFCALKSDSQYLSSCNPLLSSLDSHPGDSDILEKELEQLLSIPVEVYKLKSVGDSIDADRVDIYLADCQDFTTFKQILVSNYDFYKKVQHQSLENYDLFKSFKNLYLTFFYWIVLSEPQKQSLKDWFNDNQYTISKWIMYKYNNNNNNSNHASNSNNDDDYFENFKLEVLEDKNIPCQTSPGDFDLGLLKSYFEYFNTDRFKFNLHYLSHKLQNFIFETCPIKFDHYYDKRFHGYYLFQSTSPLEVVTKIKSKLLNSKKISKEFINLRNLWFAIYWLTLNRKQKKILKNWFKLNDLKIVKYLYNSYEYEDIFTDSDLPFNLKFEILKNWLDYFNTQRFKFDVLYLKNVCKIEFSKSELNDPNTATTSTTNINNNNNSNNNNVDIFDSKMDDENYSADIESTFVNSMPSSPLNLITQEIPETF
ncbi:uncharacterized protein ASCRUDRAFT_78151 [Ascoidea rubescens DSM 1968]|uniref:Uncharacterized protein n=1 Tax=Ascoidea rubescens DSM 1968 TaxID=1344418 RepID=A0A1D2V8S6_9ASCO|nr:hypothetical protein ASCRUDRAFT_78151 [Ascoidea rubescens DSM 1968]ODV58018.1 hypothetical protein ASCRUDRAFT_78151 [Ascoidea rubescens DSM 1968]